MAKQKSNEIEITRVYDAPVKAVWDAWTDTAQVAKWWGPRGFTITTHSKDLRPGGSWRYTMHGPDGVDWPNVTKYLEVVEGKKLVYDHGGTDDKPALFRVTVTFTEAGGKTVMEMRMSLATAEAAEETRKVIKKHGGNSTWDRLAEYLEEEQTGKEKFFIHRSFDVGREKMYEVWTDPKHFAKWLPPTGATMEFIRADIRPGGSAFYKMMWEGGMTMHGRVEYLEFTPPERLVYRQQFCDENEKVSRHPMAKTWPETMLTTVTLTEEGPDQTRVRVEWEPTGNVTPEERETFSKMRGGMTQGWTGSFDKLEAYVETA